MCRKMQQHLQREIAEIEQEGVFKREGVLLSVLRAPPGRGHSGLVVSPGVQPCAFTVYSSGETGLHGLIYFSQQRHCRKKDFHGIFIRSFYDTK
jgi:hypothetical protein